MPFAEIVELLNPTYITWSVCYQRVRFSAMIRVILLFNLTLDSFYGTTSNKQLCPGIFVQQYQTPVPWDKVNNTSPYKY